MRVVAGMGAMLCLVATGCQPGGQGAGSAPMSVEQAKQITAEFKGQGFVPPPRTITDITAVLEQYRPDAATVDAAKAAAAAAPPTGAGEAELSLFYYHRGSAAGEIGRLPQQRADLRQAVELGNRSRPRDFSWMLNELAVAEAQTGNAG